jgi:tetratricopeptide (TPR) repeat protein
LGEARSLRTIHKTSNSWNPNLQASAGDFSQRGLRPNADLWPHCGDAAMKKERAMNYPALFAGLLLLVLFPAVSFAQDSDASRPAAATPEERAIRHADALMLEKDYSLAAVAYQDVLRTDPKNALLLNKTGIAFQQLQDSEQAEKFYRRSARADKKFASPVNNVGTIEYERKRYGRAIKSYKKAIELDPTNASALSNLGYAYYANKQYPEAMQTFSKALALDPHVFDKRGGAGSFVQQRSAPDPGMFYFVLAKSYAKQGDAERAAHYLKLSRDDGYKDFAKAKLDPDFATVMKDPRVQEVLNVQPSYADDKKPVAN